MGKTEDFHFWDSSILLRYDSIRIFSIHYWSEQSVCATWVALLMFGGELCGHYNLGYFLSLFVYLLLIFSDFFITYGADFLERDIFLVT